MVLAILLREREGVRVTLVESDSRKAAFLREVARATGAPVDILCERIEKPATQAKVGESINVVTARALAPLPKLLDLSAPYFSNDTVGLFLKGREAQAEVEAAHQIWDFEAALKPSVTDSSGRIVIVRALKA
jgi:16S rRNA (guanine527-N7)-methyltransferase